MIVASVLLLVIFFSFIQMSVALHIDAHVCGAFRTDQMKRMVQVFTCNFVVVPLSNKLSNFIVFTSNELSSILCGARNLGDIMSV